MIRFCHFNWAEKLTGNQLIVYRMWPKKTKKSKLKAVEQNRLVKGSMEDTRSMVERFCRVWA